MPPQFELSTLEMNVTLMDDIFKWVVIILLAFFYQTRISRRQKSEQESTNFAESEAQPSLPGYE